MQYIGFVVDLFLNLDKHLATVIQTFGIWTYLLFFLVIFLETGVVITPFLPGDSLLFAAGAITAAANDTLNIFILWFIVFIAAFLGDTTNYWIGRYIGPRSFSINSRLFKKEYLERTQAFYNKHGGKTILLARFIPIIRTFAPFVAGIGSMRYSYFITYNIVGGFIWTALFTFTGYFFGNIPFIRDNFSIVIIAIILISIMPPFVEYLRGRKKDNPNTGDPAKPTTVAE
jgi:membrane-associated protein